jgi:RND family efflux transporter MFP subunit
LRGLVQSGAISAQTYDQAAAAAKSADEQARAALAQRDVARRQAGFSNLEADADGVVMSLAVEVGQVVGAGQPILRLARDGEREAVVFAPESRRNDLPRQATAMFPAAPTPGKVDALLRQLSQAADPLTRTYEARYTLSGAGASAPLGGTVSLQLPRATNKASVEAPLSAVVDRGGGAYVLVLAPGQSLVRKRAVQVASLTEETAVIASGLAPGEQIVALGAALLHDGQRVRIEPGK